MKLRVALLLVAAAAGCQHDKKQTETSTTPPSGSSAPKAADDMKPEPVAKAPDVAVPAPKPPEDVRPPTAADLAEYEKNVPGSGNKLEATFETSEGTIHCQLFPDKAPATVANFIGLATGQKPWLDPTTHEAQKKPFFDGLTFHRVIPGFMIQGGDPLGIGVGGPGYYFDDEIDRSLPMGPGALAMANAGVRGGHGTNGSQFFIMEGSRPDLVGHHTIFGQCKDLEVVKKIASVPTGENDKPQTPVTINKVTIAKM